MEKFVSFVRNIKCYSQRSIWSTFSLERQPNTTAWEIEERNLIIMNVFNLEREEMWKQIIRHQKFLIHQILCSNIRSGNTADYKWKCLLLWLIHNMVHWFAWKQVKQNIGITVRWRIAAKKFVVRFWNFAKNKFSASRPQRPGMMSPLKQLLADCFKTFSRWPKDWTVSGPCHLYSKPKVWKVLIKENKNWCHELKRATSHYYKNVSCQGERWIENHWRRRHEMHPLRY